MKLEIYSIFPLIVAVSDQCLHLRYFQVNRTDSFLSKWPRNGQWDIKAQSNNLSLLLCMQVAHSGMENCENAYVLNYQGELRLTILKRYELASI